MDDDNRNKKIEVDENNINTTETTTPITPATNQISTDPQVGPEGNEGVVPRDGTIVYDSNSDSGLSSSSDFVAKDTRKQPDIVKPEIVKLHEINANGRLANNGDTAVVKFSLPGSDSNKMTSSPDGGGDADEGKTTDKKQAPEKKRNFSGYFRIFKYADKYDKFLMIFGTLMAIVHGSSIPNSVWLFSKTIDIFITDNINSRNMSPYANYTSNTWEEIKPISYQLFGWALAILVAGSLHQTMWKLTGHRQCNRLRAILFQSIMRKQCGWFDQRESGSLINNITYDMVNIEGGISDKTSLTMFHLSTFLIGVTFAIIINYKLALTSLCLAPLVIISLLGLGVFIAKLMFKQSIAYGQSGSIASEVIRSIRTVQSFGGEHIDADRYSNKLELSRVIGTKKGLTLGISLGVLWMALFNIIGVASYYGTVLSIGENDNLELTGGTIIFSIIIIITSIMSLGQLLPNVEQIALAGGSATNVFSIIDQISEIDYLDTKGVDAKDMKGEIELHNVDFSFPTRMEYQVLKKISLKAKVGQTIALVGSSGSGKSTICKLLLRLYDTTNGKLTIDGVNVKDYAVKSLRRNIGVVSQEPTLFEMSIEDNIRIAGHDAEGEGHQITHEDVVRAAKQANAHDFIMNWPEKYNTLVGDRGAQLSGGQKQRIAIARALISNPKILLLDEATSALDSESEAIVQAALDKASEGRTTIIIAHRLTTIRNADLIYCINSGVLVESGNHRELMEKKDYYYNLVKSQEREKNKTEDKEVLNNDDGKLDEEENSEEKPISQEDIEKQIEMNLEKDVKNTTYSIVLRLTKLSKPEICALIFGGIASIIVGGSQPSFGVAYSATMQNFADNGVDRSDSLRVARNFTLYVFGCSIFLCFMHLLANYFFSIVGENLIKRLREMLMRAILRQEISWFDDKENRVGILSARLSKDTQSILGISGTQLGLLLQALAGFCLALFIGFYSSWKLTMVVIVFLPVLLMAGMSHGRNLKGASAERAAQSETGSKIAMEAIQNMTTVASLNLEQGFISKFDSFFASTKSDKGMNQFKYGLFFGFSQGVVQLCYGITFLVGSKLVDNKEIEFYIIFRVLMSMIIASLSIGRTTSFAPDVAVAKLSAKKLFAIIDRVPKILLDSENSKKPESCSGNIEFSGVHFNYESRANVPVLQGIDMSIKCGQKVALVGQSGCGKSTTISLVERFYDVNRGSITLDGNDLRELNTKWLREQIGLVSQEPVLFNLSIAQNISYGNNTRIATNDEIIKAAMGANIHEFITSLPNGYNTMVGEGGGQLSGGQKQRIAIARAILRNPKILLLDEATSALDAQSEKEVQLALDYAQKNRTSITIAHKLSTIKNSDVIFVFSEGVVVEKGTHEELMAIDQFYGRLVKTQMMH